MTDMGINFMASDFGFVEIQCKTHLYRRPPRDAGLGFFLQSFGKKA
jgi:hypothetical protein